MLTHQQTTWIMQRALSIGVPRHITVPLVRDYLKWCQCSGEEWAVARMKSIKLDLIRTTSGLAPVGQWIRKNRKGLYSGWIGSAYRYAGSTHKHFKQVVALIGIYTSSVSSQITITQEEKFLSGVTASPKTVPVSLEEGIGLAADRFRSTAKKAKLQPLLTYPPNDRTLISNDGVLDSVLSLSTAAGFRHFLKWKTNYLPVLGDLLYKQLMNNCLNPKSWDDWNAQADSRLVIGRIGFTQEPGFKLRAYASPGKVFQRVLEPLGKALYKRVLKKLPWDCTYDQAKPFPIIREHLLKGKLAHSVDLTGATDYFPLALQQIALKRLLPKMTEDIDLFSEISRSYWTYRDRQVQWTKGQPLGLYPSFAAFAVTHGLLLYHLADYDFHDQFFVLGDDVVILDDDLAVRYKTALQHLDCPISESKSISSTTLCEFAGKIITPGGITPSLKWNRISDSNFMDILKAFGPGMIRFLTPRQRKVAKKIGPLPEELGGLGWNPDGLDLRTRIESHPWLFEDPYSVAYEMSLDRIMVHRLMTSDIMKLRRDGRGAALLRYSPLLIPGDLDQRSRKRVAIHLHRRLVPLYRVLGGNLGVVDKTINLPSEFVSNGKRTTQLSQLEAKLR